MDHASRKIIYLGDAARAGALVQMLEEEGVVVDWSPPMERHHLRLLTDINDAIVQMVATGGVMAIGAGVKKFKKRFPRARVMVKGGPDDGGFLPGEDDSCIHDKGPSC